MDLSPTMTEPSNASLAVAVTNQQQTRTIAASATLENTQPTDQRVKHVLIISSLSLVELASVFLAVLDIKSIPSPSFLPLVVFARPEHTRPTENPVKSVPMDQSPSVTELESALLVLAVTSPPCPTKTIAQNALPESIRAMDQHAKRVLRVLSPSMVEHANAFHAESVLDP